MLILRPYQELLVTDCSNAFRGNRRVLAVAPTGAGKTVVFSEVTRRTRAKNRRIVLIAHRIEIVEQISRALTRIGVDHGIVAPGHKLRLGPVMVAMVRSLAPRLGEIPQPDLLVIDEAHHATAGTYRKIAEAWATTYVLGVTATPARTDGKGLGEAFDVLVEGPAMAELVTRGYLSGYRYLAPPQKVDLSGIATRAGDFAKDQVAAAMDRTKITGDAVAHYSRHLGGRSAIAFCASVAHAEHVAEQFIAAGFRAASVDGTMDPRERARRIAAIGNGGLQVLTSCDIVSEGTDIPAVSGAILLRPTQSLIVYLQQVGRVLRPKPDGSPAVILDHVGNVLRHGMPDDAREWSLEGRKGKPKPVQVRQCSECYMAFRPVPKCPGCGFVFPIKARKQTVAAAGAGDLSQVDAAQVKQMRVQETADALAWAWRTRNYGEAIAAFRQVGEVRGYKRGWAWAQMALWKRRHGAAKAA